MRKLAKTPFTPMHKDSTPLRDKPIMLCVLHNTNTNKNACRKQPCQDREAGHPRNGSPSHLE